MSEKQDLKLPTLEESTAFLHRVLQEDYEGRVMTFVEDPSCWWYLIVIDNALRANAAAPVSAGDGQADGPTPGEDAAR